MLEEGFEYGEAGIRAFTENYGLLEEITVIEPADNACSEARITKRVRHRPGASPLLFGRFLMSLGAFVSLGDISDALPLLVRGIQCVRNLNRQLQKLFCLEPPFRGPMPQRLPFQNLHCNEGPTVVLANVMNGADIRVIECRGSTGLSLEPL
jgi:hypothetical protein